MKDSWSVKSRALAETAIPVTQLPQNASAINSGGLFSSDGRLHCSESRLRSFLIPAYRRHDLFHEALRHALIFESSATNEDFPINRSEYLEPRSRPVAPSVNFNSRSQSLSIRRVAAKEYRCGFERISSLLLRGTITEASVRLSVEPTESRRNYVFSPLRLAARQRNSFHFPAARFEAFSEPEILMMLRLESCSPVVTCSLEIELNPMITS